MGGPRGQLSRGALHHLSLSAEDLVQKEQNFPNAPGFLPTWFILHLEGCDSQGLFLVLRPLPHLSPGVHSSPRVSPDCCCQD